MTILPAESIPIMPYSLVRGQPQLKLALELAFVAHRLEGVLLSGERGTGKSTAVRAFSAMAYGRLPVTLPINATEDRVVGGWYIDELLRGEPKPQPGLLEEAHGTILYIDEVNLLDDHIVNIILDVTSTGKLVVEREGRDETKDVRFTMVGTMNPSEGGLRPQLLDRFALMVDVAAADDETVRMEILNAVLDYDEALALERAGKQGDPLQKLNAARKEDLRHRDRLRQAKQVRFAAVQLTTEMARRCVRIGRQFRAEGHRGDYIMALAARAHAALRGSKRVEPRDLIAVAPLALQHRRPAAQQGAGALWTPTDTEVVTELALGRSPAAMAAVDGGREAQVGAIDA